MHRCHRSLLSTHIAAVGRHGFLSGRCFPFESQYLPVSYLPLPRRQLDMTTAYSAPLFLFSTPRLPRPAYYCMGIVWTVPPVTARSGYRAALMQGTELAAATKPSEAYHGNYLRRYYQHTHQRIS